MAYPGFSRGGELQFTKGIHQPTIITTRKRSLGQGNIFTSVCQEFCSQGGMPHCILGYHPRPGKEKPRATQTPLHSACWEIRSTSGRYASYWNAFCCIFIPQKLHGNERIWTERGRVPTAHPMCAGLNPLSSTI